MPIKAFGVYAAILIPVNFILVSFLLPPMLVFYDSNIKHRSICDTPKSLGTAERGQNYNESPSDLLEEAENRCADNFFGNYWNTAVKFLRWPLLLLFLAWGAYAGYIAKDIQPLAEAE